MLSYDVERFKEFYRKWQKKGIYEKPLPTNDYVIELAMRKAVCIMKSATDEQKKEAIEWLYEHGSKPIEL